MTELTNGMYCGVIESVKVKTHQIVFVPWTEAHIDRQQDTFQTRTLPAVTLHVSYDSDFDPGVALSAPSPYSDIAQSLEFVRTWLNDSYYVQVAGTGVNYVAQNVFNGAFKAPTVGCP